MPDPFLILMFGLLAVMIFFTWRNGKKRKAEAEEMQTKFVVGAEVMTQQGIFGTIVSIDEDTNIVVLESTPGTQLRVHRQTLTRVVDDEVVDDESADGVDDADEALDDNEPEFGERTDNTKPRGQKPSETDE